MVARWALLAVLLLSSGCGSLAQEDAARAARGFAGAVAEQRSDAACALVAPRAASDCTDAIEDMDEPGEVRAIEVWGEEARAETGTTVMFLHEFASGWLVTAAGCPRGRRKPLRVRDRRAMISRLMLTLTMMAVVGGLVYFIVIGLAHR